MEPAEGNAADTSFQEPKGLQLGTLQMRKKENEDTAFVALMFVLTLSICALNLFVLFFGIMAMWLLNEDHDLWDRWKRVVKALYYISLCVLMVGAACCIVVCVFAVKKGQIFLMILSIYIFLVSIVQIVFARRTFNAVFGLYQSITEDLRVEGNYETHKGFS